jgi:hypothetical protein
LMAPDPRIVEVRDDMCHCAQFFLCLEYRLWKLWWYAFFLVYPFHRLQMWTWQFTGVRSVKISNPDIPSSTETGVNSEIRSWKKHLFEWARCQKAIDGIYFTKKWRAENLQHGLEFDNFKPRLKSGIFKCISWLNGSCFGGYDRGFLNEWVKTYQMAPMSPR